MQITGIRAWRVELPLHEGRYSWSNDNSVDVFDSTVVAVDTDAGVTGWGEVCPLGPAYLPAYAERRPCRHRARLGPALIGQDPRRARSAQPAHGPAAARAPLRQVGARHGLLGHPGQGRRPAGLRRCWAAATARASRSTARSRRKRPTPWPPRSRRYRAEGYRKFQLKVGGEVEADIARIRACAAVLEPGDVLVADANTGWTMHEAARVCDAVRDVDVYIEQPCASYEACLTVRRRTAKPFVLDEVMDGLEMVVRGHADGAMDVINLKIGKVGGLTRARQIRDFCVAHGHRHDDRGQLGRRHRHGRHRPPRPQHAARVPVLGDRLQQLRHA